MSAQAAPAGDAGDFGEIEAALLRDAAVARALVAEREDPKRGRHLVAYLVPDDAALRAAHCPDYESSLQTSLRQWAVVFDLTYGKVEAPGAGPGAAPDFRGWNSSYSGAPIPLEEMEDWVAQAVARIAAREPGRVLEIGCGGGLLLQHLADGRPFTGTDISAAALERVKGWIAGQPRLAHARLLRRDAADLVGFADGEFDTVVLNSVVQYFPDGDYLLSVIREAVRILAPGGRIFLGDLRHLGLTRAFHSSVQLHRAPPTLPVGELRRRIERAIANDRELTVDPLFFRTLADAVPRIGPVEVALKAGRFDNELVRYRYDATIYLDSDAASAPAAEELPAGTPASLAAALHDRPPAIVMRGIANARLHRDAAATRLLPGFDDSATVADLLAAVSVDAAADAAHPDDFREAAAAAGYEASVFWSASGGDGRFDVALRDPRVAPLAAAARQRTPGSCHAYLSDPLRPRLRQALARRLKESVTTALPPAMVPSAYLFLDSLPLTAAGEIDREALPPPD